MITATIELPPRRAWVVRYSPTGLYLTKIGSTSLLLVDAVVHFNYADAEECLWGDAGAYLEEVSVATIHRISKP